jgi:hypothetical protein
MYYPSRTLHSDNRPLSLVFTHVLSVLAALVPWDNVLWHGDADSIHHMQVATKIKANFINPRKLRASRFHESRSYLFCRASFFDTGQLTPAIYESKMISH